MNVDFDNISKEDWEEYRTKLDKEINKKLEELKKEEKKRSRKVKLRNIEATKVKKSRRKANRRHMGYHRTKHQKSSKCNSPKKKKTPEIEETGTISRVLTKQRKDL